jgi:N-acyl-D-amino-acid deacylase
MQLDWLIKGGYVIDGTEDALEDIIMNIGIKGDRIVYIEKPDKKQTPDKNIAERIIDASGLVVCPGFIDVHSHSDFTILADGRAEAKVLQGITTEINGNCGMSAAPLYGDALEHRERELRELGIKQRWRSLKEYLSILNNHSFSLNLMTLVGHGNLRACVSGFFNRLLKKSEMEKMLDLLEEAITSGAVGMSTGLVYPPGIYASTEEISRLAKASVKYGARIYTTHLRDEGEHLQDAVEETLQISMDADIKVHISHLKTYGRQNWDKINKLIEVLNSARAKNIKITCDRYPYIASCTDLDAVLPPWTYEGGSEYEIKRLKNERKKIIDEVSANYPADDSWERIMVSKVSSDRNRWMEGMNLLEISKRSGISPADCLINLLLEEDLKVDAIFFFMSEENLKSILKLPYTMIGSDSAARSFSGITARGKPHPRSFGSFPRVFAQYVREEGILPLNLCVNKVTGLPAVTFGIKKRGFIRKGFYADIVIFDPNRIKDKSTFNNPYKRPEGIYHVFVNGVPVMLNGELTRAMPGRIIV